MGALTSLKVKLDTGNWNRSQASRQHAKGGLHATHQVSCPLCAWSTPRSPASYIAHESLAWRAVAARGVWASGIAWTLPQGRRHFGSSDVICPDQSSLICELQLHAPLSRQPLYSSRRLVHPLLLSTASCRKPTRLLPLSLYPSASTLRDAFFVHEGSPQGAKLCPLDPEMSKGGSSHGMGWGWEWEGVEDGEGRRRRDVTRCKEDKI